MAKLTLSIDDDIIRRAKKLAAERDTSVSAMVSRFLASMPADEEARDEPQNRKQRPIGPITKQLTGIIKLPDDKSYRELLEEALVERYGE